MKKFWLIGRFHLFLFTSFLTLQFISAFAQPGSLDPTFSGDGKLTDWSGRANGVAIQADGKIVAVGRTPANTSLGVFIVARYNPDGSRDETFGGAGRVSIPIGFFGSSFGVDVAIQPDGKIVVTCYDDDQNFGAIVRLNVDGSLDTSFGSNGSVGTTGSVYSVAIQPDGKIITSAGVPYNNPFNYRIRRYNANGSVDTTFGTGGVTDSPIAATAVVVQNDGKIVAAGQASNAFAVARLNPDGTADQSFGNGGLATTATVGSEASSVSVQSDGKIVAVSTHRTVANQFLVRYNANGTLDSTFDNDGIVSLAEELCCWAYYSFRHVVALNDGGIVVKGTSFNGSNYDFAIGRYNADGSLDTTFGSGDGVTTVDFNNSTDYASAISLDTQGRLVVVGESNESFALARIKLNAPPLFDFDGDGRSDVSVFRPSDGVWYLNQSTNGFSATRFGLSNDRITPADFDGDGKTDISVYRDGTWYWLNSSDNNFQARHFGIASDIPVPADYDSGGGRAELAVYRDGSWWILNLFNEQVRSIQFGLATDRPVPADYDGDGRADQAVYRNGEWHLNRSTQGYAVVGFGLAGDRPVVGDYDRDGRADPAVYRGGTWYILGSSQGFRVFEFGLPNDIPAGADYDGDGKTDAAVFRDGTWYVNRSSGGTSIQQFGLPNDSPVPAAYLGF